MSKFNVRVGDKFGNYKIIDLNVNDFILPSGQKNKAVLCLCDCGSIKKVRYFHLVNGRTLSCGCSKYAYGIKPNKNNSYIRKTYNSIKRRISEKGVDKHIYYDRGITMCKEWSKDFHLFYKWAKENGLKKGRQIDRIDNSKGYNQENCRVVSPKKNARNKRNNLIVEWKGKKVPLVSLVRRKGMFKHYDSVKGRIKRGWSIDKAVDTPIRKGNYERNGRTKVSS